MTERVPVAFVQQTPTVTTGKDADDSLHLEQLLRACLNSNDGLQDTR